MEEEEDDARWASMLNAIALGTTLEEAKAKGLVVTEADERDWLEFEEDNKDIKKLGFRLGGYGSSWF